MSGRRFVFTLSFLAFHTGTLSIGINTAGFTRAAFLSGSGLLLGAAFGLACRRQP